ncbi:Rieske 2Fe-2S domain-containing protein [Zavarzinia sp. CC-PAN008]|uniref:Rieske 2Fe-2S domain-containing protein n=1 Tax=Zavarzinia sp. CC-PAN008 TaxID=3243332 RepID=UPI003F742F85
MSAVAGTPRTLPVAERRGRESARPLPAEGENGVFTQSWWPVCLAEEVAAAQVKGFGFLDGRVVVFRTAAGKATVMSAYCPHLGADLAVGEVVDDTVRCAFHHWRYDATGACVATLIGDPPPPRACLFVFPTIEKYGLIWAFNGTEPHYELPDFPVPHADLEFRTFRIDGSLPVDPWIVCANTPDIQHIKALHGIRFAQEDPHDEVEWTPHSMYYNFTGYHKQGEPIDNRVGIVGTSLYYQHTLFNGQWFGFLAPFGMPSPGETVVYMVVAARRDMGPPEAVGQFLDFISELETQIVMEDWPIMRTIRFAPAHLTKSDRTLARFFQYMRDYPRAHPSAPFIR